MTKIDAEFRCPSCGGKYWGTVDLDAGMVECHARGCGWTGRRDECGLSESDYLPCYNLARLLNDGALRNLIVGYCDADTTTERLALTMDTRIPANCIGYVSQLCSPQATRAVQLDAARMLSRFVSFGTIPQD